MRFGVHVSVAGGVSKAVERAVGLGCDCFQVFVANPRSWSSPRLHADEAQRFRQFREAAKRGPVAVHLSYLPNLATADRAIRTKSLHAFLAQAEDAALLGAEFFVLHPGAATGDDPDGAPGRLAEALRRVLDRLPEGPVFCLENMAGGGRTLGATPEELAEIDRLVGAPERIGVCFDTAHALAAGDPVGEAGAMARMRRRYHRAFGRHPIRMLHLNDLRTRPGGRHDRHHHLGRGHHGEDGLRNILHTPGLRRLPVILETPVDEDGDDRSNLAAARRLAG